MFSFENPKPSYRVKGLGERECEEVFRPIDKSVESYYEFHTYAPNGVSKFDRVIMTQRCVDLIQSVGGEIREGWSAQVGLVFYTLPRGVPNPIRETDPHFHGKVVTRFWPAYSEKEREIFGLNKK